MRALFHLVGPAAWAAAGPHYRPESLSTEGFVHCSFAEQVQGSANRHFPDAAELCVVELDPDRIEAPIRVEDSYGTGTAFPHVYGAIPVAAAVAVHELVRDEAGAWRFSWSGASDGAAQDR